MLKKLKYISFQQRFIEFPKIEIGDSYSKHITIVHLVVTIKIVSYFVVDDNTVLHGMFTLLEKVCCCEIGILYSKIAHILQQGINGFFLTLLMKRELTEKIEKKIKGGTQKNNK